MFVGRNYFDSWKLNHSTIFHMIDCERNPLMFWTIVFLILAWAQNASDDVLTVGHFAVPDDPVNHRPHCVHPHELNRNRSKGSPFLKSDPHSCCPPPPLSNGHSGALFCQTAKALLKKGHPLEVNILEDNPVTGEELTFVKSLSKTQTNMSQDEENWHCNLHIDWNAITYMPCIMTLRWYIVVSSAFWGGIWWFM